VDVGSGESLPRLTNNHGHIFASQTKRNHAEEIQHPIHGKRAMSIRHWISYNHTSCQHSHSHLRNELSRRTEFLNSSLRLTRHGIVVEEIDLERHAHETVREREEQVGSYSRSPAPGNELGEFQRRVALGGEILHVDGHVEGEAEEGYDDQIYADTSAWEADVVMWKDVQMRPIDTAGMLVYG
jgi:glutaredoxin